MQVIVTASGQSVIWKVLACFVQEAPLINQVTVGHIEIGGYRNVLVSMALHENVQDQDMHLLHGKHCTGPLWTMTYRLRSACA